MPALLGIESHMPYHTPHHLPYHTIYFLTTPDRGISMPREMKRDLGSSTGLIECYKPLS